jgi:hypothetical protein
LIFGHLARAAGIPVDTNAVLQAAWGGASNAPAASVNALARSASPTVLRAHPGADDTYALCGVPARERVALRALQGALATPSVAIEVGETRIARRDITLTDGAAMWLVARADSMSAESAVADSTGSTTIAGTVSDGVGRPISGARVVVAGVAEAVTTDANGRYVSRDLPGGSRIVSVEKIGYAPVRTIADLYPFDSVTVNAQMARVTALATVNINERQRRSALVTEINARIAGAPARFVDSTKIAKMASTPPRRTCRTSARSASP